MNTEFEIFLVIMVGIIMETEVIMSGIVEGGITVGGIVDSSNAVVYVKITWPPRTLAGIADPTPEAVNCVGIDRVDVLGIAELFWEYILPSPPLASV